MPQTYKYKFTIEVDYICDECNNGNIRVTGVTLTTNPPWYVHKCDNRGHESRETETFPRMEFMDELPWKVLK